MRATVKNDTTTRVITLEVSSVPDVDVTENWHQKSRVMRPDHVEITLVNGRFRQAVVSGPLVKLSGEPGRNRDSARYARYTLDESPEWLQRLVREASAGVTSWGRPTDVPA